MSFFSSIAGDALKVGLDVGIGISTGGAGLALESALGAIGSSVISQVGVQLGLNSGAINLAQDAFSGAFGGSADFGGALESMGASAMEQGQFSGQIDAIANLITSDLIQNLQNSQSQSTGSGDDGSSNSVGASGSVGAGGVGAAGVGASGLSSADSGSNNFLVALATALGEALDQKLDDMANLSNQIGNVGTGASSQSQLGKLTGQLQAVGQEVSMLSSALTNSLQSIGQGLSSLAKKD
jgi:hypothetical protein